MSLTVAEFAELNELKVEDAIESLNRLFTEYEYDYSVSREDNILDDETLEFLENIEFIIDKSQLSNLNESNIIESENASNSSSQVNFNVESFFNAYKQINNLDSIFNDLSNSFNINISSTEVSLDGFYNAKNIINSIGSETITELKQNINDTKKFLEENDANVALLFKFLDGDFNDEEGFYNEDLIEDAMETAGLTEDIYGLMDIAKQYNQILTDYYFEAEWQNGTFLKEDGEIDYDAIDKYLEENKDVSSEVVDRCKENQLFINELGKGSFNDTDGEIDRNKVDDYVADHPLITSVDTIIENFEIQVANMEFINNFETLFVDEEGNINENDLNKYLEENPKVNTDIAIQVVNVFKDNKLLQKRLDSGDFFDDNGCIDREKVDRFVEKHPYTTMNTEEVFKAYEEQYANLRLLEEYEKGTFKDSIGNWNEEAYQNYIKEHPNATNGEDLKSWYLNEYPDLTPEEYQQQITQTVTVSFACGVVDIFETVLDGGAFLLGTIGEALGIEGSKETMGQFIQKDFSGALYDSWIGALGVRSDVAYGKAHTVGTIAGKIVGTALLTAVPGGCVVSASVGALSAAGSAAETAFQSGADVDSAFEVAGVALILGAVSGYGLDKIANSVKLGTMSLKHGLGAAALVSAAEPIGNSIIEYGAYGNKMTDSEGNVLYDNYLDYYVESGALLNTGIAIAGSSIKVGSSYLKGVRQFQEVKKAYVDKVVESKMDDAKWNYAKQQYELKNGKDSFWNLSDAERGKLKAEVDVSTNSFKLKQAEYERIAQDTVDSILELKSNGMIKPEYSAKDVLTMIEDGVPQEKYLTKSAVSEWKKYWTPDANGNVEVYLFQDSSNSYALKNGTVGRPPTSGSTSINPAGDGGAFVMTKNQYESLLANRNIFDANGNCINVDALSEALGGVKFQGSPISIKQTVPLDSVEMPMGNNQGSLLGEWRPGGKTSGGVVEGVVPQNFTGNSSNGSTLPGTTVEIIKH